jgi:peroxiredoxin
VFHSTAEELLRYQYAIPYDIVADPDLSLYRAFGVERSLLSVADPRAWLPALRGVARLAVRLPSRGASALALPADFLIDPGGGVVECKYGALADDQWDVDELLALAARYRQTRTDAPPSPKCGQSLAD